MHYNDALNEHLHKHLNLVTFFKLPESKQNYIRFTFVRNPYDRLYSGFLQRQHRLTEDPPPKLDVRLLKDELASIRGGFGEYVAFFTDRYKRKAGGPSSLCAHVYHDRDPAVHYVGFLETFEASLSQICDLVGITELGAGNANVRYELSGVDAARTHSNAQFRYLEKFDPETIRIVNETFAEDFNKLGYRMVEPLGPGPRGSNDGACLSPFSDIAPPARNGDILSFEGNLVG